MFRTSVNVMTGEVTVVNLTPEEIIAKLRAILAEIRQPSAQAVAIQGEDIVLFFVALIAAAIGLWLGITARLSK